MSETVERVSAALADRYRIEHELGAGGMATVYLAEDLKHDRKVAVKVLKPELAAVLGAERFVAEIKTTASLQHPHILPLHDSGEADGFLYYVMPFIDGETLRDKLSRETQLSVEEAVKIATEVADALEYAHGRGVIHRDIKPENILLHNNRPMIADFGIALAVSAAAGGRMTETGMSLGTPHYMSPEQATADRDLTSRADIYSLGAVLYEMLSGDPPHTGSSAQQIIMKIVTDPVRPVTELRKSVPTNVAHAVAHALEKLAADRFQTAKAFAEALANPAFRSTGTVQLPAEVRVGSSRAVAGLSALVVALVIALGWVGTRPAPSQPVTRYGVALPAEQAVDSRSYVTLSADGSRVAYIGPSEIPGMRRVWVKERDQLTARPVLGTDGASTMAISPGGDRIAVVILNDIRVTTLDGGGFTTITGGVSGAGHTMTWLDDGSFVYVARDRFALQRVTGANATPTTIWESDSIFPQGLTALPDGRGVLFHGCVPPCGTGNLYALELGADSAHVVVRNSRRGQVVEDVLFYVVQGSGSIPTYAAAFDRRTLTVRGDPVALADSVLSPGDQPFFNVAPNGTGVLVTGGPRGESGDYEMVWVDQAGRETPIDTTWQFRVTQFAADYGWALSPDDRQLVIGLNTGGSDDIWVKQLARERGPLSRITFGLSPERRPRWRPDGRWITFLTDTSVTMRRADGTGADSIIWTGRADEAILSDDGNWLLLRKGATTAGAGGRDIFIMRIGEDAEPRPLFDTPYDEMAVRLSPDARWLAYQSDETGRREIFVRPFPNVGDGKVQVSSEGGTGPLWSRDGREFYYARDDGMMMAVPVEGDGSLRVDDERELFQIAGRVAGLNAWYYTPWDIGRDGRFIMTRQVATGAEQPATLVVVENWLAEARAALARAGR